MKRQRAVPAKRELDPLDIPSLLPNLLILEWPGEGDGVAGPVVRLAGTRFKRPCGNKLDGMPVFSLFDDNSRPDLSAGFSTLKTDGKALALWQPVENGRGIRSVLESVYLPLEDDVGSIRFAVAGAHTVSGGEDFKRAIVVQEPAGERPASIALFDPLDDEARWPDSVVDENRLAADRLISGTAIPAA